MTTKPDQIDEREPIAALFAQLPPDGWGLRGDPYLWKKLEEYFLRNGLPEAREDFDRELRTAFTLITGKEPVAGDYPYVKSLDYGECRVATC